MSLDRNLCPVHMRRKSLQKVFFSKRLDNDAVRYLRMKLLENFEMALNARQTKELLIVMGTARFDLRQDCTAVKCLAGVHGDGGDDVSTDIILKLTVRLAYN